VQILPCAFLFCCNPGNQGQASSKKRDRLFRPHCLFHERSRIEVGQLDILEVFGSSEFKLDGGIFVADDYSPWVQLQDADGPEVIDGSFDGVPEGVGLIVVVDDNQDFPVVHNCADADGKSGFRGFNIILLTAKRR
jgi:hypothetical protein